MRIAGWILTLALAATATAHAASPFSYWLFSLSWSPEFCKANLSSKEPQCSEENYFVVDGLLPHVSGPDASSCPTGESVPNDLIERMMPVTKNQAVIKRLWKKQGACSGLPMKEYFLQMERAARKIVVPSEYRGILDDIRTSPAAIKEAFSKVNPGLDPEAVFLECRGKYVTEVKFCMDANFDFRACGLDLGEDCQDDTRLRSMSSRFGPHHD